MLPRTPEPELMDDAAQAQAYADADFQAPHDAIADRFVTMFGANARGIALDVGCGPADVVVRIAKRCPLLVIDGIDGADSMLALGRERIVREGLHNRVRLYRAFVPDDPLPRVGVDFVTSNSILHHLHEPQGLWSVVRRASRAGTRVYITDLMRPDSADDVERFVDIYADGEPDVLRRDFRASLYAAFTVDEVKAQLAAAGLPLMVQAISDRHLLVSGTL